MSHPGTSTALPQAADFYHRRPKAMNTTPALSPSLDRSTTKSKLQWSLPMWPGAIHTSQEPEKFLTTTKSICVPIQQPISSWGQFLMLQRKTEEQTNPEATLCMKGGEKKHLSWPWGSPGAKKWDVGFRAGCEETIPSETKNHHTKDKWEKREL